MPIIIIPKKGFEISDRIVSFDPTTLARQPVHKEQLIQEFIQRGNRTAADIVATIPEKDGWLVPDAVDQLLISVHCEMQRVSEEFQHGQRVAELLRPLLLTFRDNNIPKPIRIVDIGCGTGFAIRWLASRGALGSDVELIGVDYNTALITEAERLARIENLHCTFVVGNAFRLKHPAAIYLSTGILHHFRDNDLVELFRNHNDDGTFAFVHFDFKPSPMAPLGSWLFHKVRMRQPLAQHDGVLSAIRAHSSEELLNAARTGAPEFASVVFGTRLWGLPIPRVFNALVGIRPPLKNAFLKNLGRRIKSLGFTE